MKRVLMLVMVISFILTGLARAEEVSSTQYLKYLEKPIKYQVCVESKENCLEYGIDQEEAKKLYFLAERSEYFYLMDSCSQREMDACVKLVNNMKFDSRCGFKLEDFGFTEQDIYLAMQMGVRNRIDLFWLKQDIKIDSDWTKFYYVMGDILYMNEVTDTVNLEGNLMVKGRQLRTNLLKFAMKDRDRLLAKWRSDKHNKDYARAFFQHWINWKPNYHFDELLTPEELIIFNKVLGIT